MYGASADRLSAKKKLLASAAVVSGMVLAGAAFGIGAAGAQTTESAEERVPAYEVIDVFDAAGIVEIDVATGVETEDKLRLIAEELRENEANVPDGGTLLVEYYDAEDTTENTGFALVFDDEQAVLDSGDSEQFGQVYDEEEAERIITEEDGMRVVSYKDFEEENSGIWGAIKRFLI